MYRGSTPIFRGPASQRLDRHEGAEAGEVVARLDGGERGLGGFGDHGAAGVELRPRLAVDLRGHDVARRILYVFTNTVYNNLSNTLFMADVVGGIGGRPVILVYRISRAASDAEVLEHCLVVAKKLYHNADQVPGFPEQVIGIYRMPESDAVALGKESPKLIPLAEITRGRDLATLLRDLDVSHLKRQIFASDLASITQDAERDLLKIQREAEAVVIYRLGLQQALAQQALEALKTFPLHEAIGLATRLFLETGPGYVKVLRGTGRIVGAPFRAVQRLGRAFINWAGSKEPPVPAQNPEAVLSHDLLLAANTLRNRLMDDHLIVPVTRKDSLYTSVERAKAHLQPDKAPFVEPVGIGGTFNLHIPVPAIIQAQEGALLTQDWEATTQELQQTAHQLMGLPVDIEDELRSLVIQFRSQMSLSDRLRETLFASLSALPALLGVSYTLLTANPVSGAGIWIRLQSLFGINDLWALVSIPASAGLSEQERKQLELTITPVFKLWLERRMSLVIEILMQTVCRPVLETLEHVPLPSDQRFASVTQALQTLKETP